jgi:hypothetical protein
MPRLRRIGLAFAVGATLCGAAARADFIDPFVRVNQAIPPTIRPAGIPGNTLWYNGDFDGNDGLSNEINSAIADARVFDNFVVPGGRIWSLEGVFSNNLLTSDFDHDASGKSTPVTRANWTVRTGVSVGNGGTVVAGGTSAATEAPTGRTFTDPVLGVLTENTILVSGLNGILLGPGTYWLQVTPVAPNPGLGQSFESTTSGAGAIGTPPGNDGNSFFDSTTFGADFVSASDFLGLDRADFSEGVTGISVVAIPEPGPITLAGIGILGLLGYGWYRRRRATTDRDAPTSIPCQAYDSVRTPPGGTPVGVLASVDWKPEDNAVMQELIASGRL